MIKTTVLAVLALTVVLAACRRQEQPAPESASPTPAAETPAPRETAPPQTATGIDVGATMPEYASMWLDGSKFDLASRRGSVVLLNLWATWCGPCRHEIPELQAIHDKYKGQKFEVIGVSVDESGADTVKQFVQEQKMTYPVALDAEGEIANLLQTSVLPTSVLLDRSGKIVWKKFGAVMPNDAELVKAIETAL